MQAPSATPYCECETPVMDVEHDAGCRRCGRPVDFSPQPGALDLSRVRDLKLDDHELVEGAFYVADSLSPRIIAGPFVTFNKANTDRIERNIANDCTIVQHVSR
jgi:hypothetical protein